MGRHRIHRDDMGVNHRVAFERNKKRIYATQRVCGICGKPVDFSLRYPNPLSPSIDHIIPLARGGHPSDIDNLQLAHLCCNNDKRDKVFSQNVVVNQQPDLVSNRNLPQTRDWSTFKG